LNYRAFRAKNAKSQSEGEPTQKPFGASYSTDISVRGEYRREFYRDPSQFVLGMVEGGEARAWSFEQLMREPVLNDEFRRSPVLIVFMSDSATAMVYDRRVDDRTLTFNYENGKLLDTQTGTQWESASGEAVAGPLRATQLTRRVGTVSYLRAWRDFHPDSSYWKSN
jgi:hypothetical protein